LFPRVERFGNIIALGETVRDTWKNGEADKSSVSRTEWMGERT
jgi:hypothetical protein